LSRMLLVLVKSIAHRSIPRGSACGMYLRSASLREAICDRAYERLSHETHREEQGLPNSHGDISEP